MIIKDHVPYKFFHHGKWYVAYDQLGRELATLETAIQKKHEAFDKDKTKSRYYFDLILNLENQFSRMLLEGRNAGSITMLVNEGINESAKEAA